MPREYNFMFNEIVSDDYDFVGYVAYSLYKIDKIGFIESYKQDHSGKAPSNEDLRPFHEKSCEPEKIDRYRKRAREIIRTFLSTILSEKSEEIEQDYIEDRENYLKAKLGTKASMGTKAQLRKLASEYEETEKLKKAEDESEKQFDRKMLSFISHNVKNDIQSMKAIVINHKNEISVSVADKLQLHFDNIKEILSDFDTAISDKKINVSSVIDVLKKMMEDDCRKINTNFHCEFVDEIVMKGSSRSIIEMLMNLMRNAIDAVEKVNDPRIEVVAGIKDGFCLFHIKDNGCGIAAEYISKIFDNGFTTKPNGTGKGLCYVKYGVESYFGGKVYVNKYKEEGFSTIFTIEIPVK